jgi:hypothetical protein
LTQGKACRFDMPERIVMQLDAFEQWRRSRTVATNKLRGILARRAINDNDTANNAPLRRLPTKGQMVNARKSFKALARRQQTRAMTNMPAPAGHRPVPRFVGEREKVLWNAHIKRLDSGWLHG